jgi:hypothetical protein
LIGFRDENIKIEGWQLNRNMHVNILESIVCNDVFNYQGAVTSKRIDLEDYDSSRKLMQRKHFVTNSMQRDNLDIGFMLRPIELSNINPIIDLDQDEIKFKREIISALNPEPFFTGTFEEMASVHLVELSKLDFNKFNLNDLLKREYIPEKSTLISLIKFLNKNIKSEEFTNLVGDETLLAELNTLTGGLADKILNGTFVLKKSMKKTAVTQLKTLNKLVKAERRAFSEKYLALKVVYEYILNSAMETNGFDDSDQFFTAFNDFVEYFNGDEDDENVGLPEPKEQDVLILYKDLPETDS